MTITLTREEAQQVLDALIYTQTAGIKLANVSDAVETLRARLSAPEPDVDWKDMYEKEKRLREMLADKYEKDLRKLGRAVPTAQPEPEPVAICPNCLGTKRPHSIDPEWKGRCDCAPPQRKPWDNKVPITDEYERGVIDGMQKQMQSSVDKAVNEMAKREWQSLTDEQVRDLWSWSATAEAERTANTQQHAFARAIEAKLKEKNK
jgi:hypothetical protein